MSTETIGSTLIELDNLDAISVCGLVTVAGHNYDARTGQELIVPSRNLEVYFCVKERIIARQTGEIRTVPNGDNWDMLFPNEYEMVETLQPPDETSNKPWTFRWQPTRERMPLFHDVGVYEVWFKFVTTNSNQDDIRLVCTVCVGLPSTPRCVDYVS